MKIVIDVPEEVYEALKSITEDATSLDPYSLADIIVNKSKPLDDLSLQSEWIPVSERLPDEEDYRPSYGFEDGCVMWQTDNGDIGFGWYYHSTKCWSDIYDHPIEAGKVIAWQPLPEPYKKGGAE